MKYYSTLVLFLLSCVPVFGQQRPFWVTQRPADPGYYIGIAGVQKEGTPQEYMQRAKSAALNDIAQQIVVTVSGEQLNRISERLGELSSEYQSDIRATTSAELEGVETVDTWDGSQEYWVYCRLSRDLYAKREAEKLEKATSLSIDLYSKAIAAEAKGDLSDAAQYYVQSLSSVSKYISRSLQVQYHAKEIFLGNELVTSFQSLLDKIKLKAVPARVAAQVGKEVEQPLEVVATNQVSGKRIAYLPIKYSFIRGSGLLTTTAATNSAGIATSRITKLTGTDKLQIVGAALEVSPSTGEAKRDPVTEILLRSFTIPETRFILDVSMLAVYFDVQEKMFGNPMGLPQIEPAMKEVLSSQGFTFVTNPSKASISITIQSDSRMAGNFQGFHTAYVDANVSVTDMSSGDEIYKMSYDNTKGVSSTYQDAAMKAYAEVARKMRQDVVPAVLAHLLK